MVNNPFGWDLPAGAANDPNAPWNKDESHCMFCCDYQKCENDEWFPVCVECDEEDGDGVCYLFDSYPLQFLPIRLGRWLSSIQVLKGLFDSYCSIPDEPECTCEDCDCNIDDGDAKYEEMRDREYDD